jgi:hypothetical protein
MKDDFLMPKHLDRDSENLTSNTTQKSTENPFEEIYSLQEELITETESLVGLFYDEIKADILNFDAIQAICFLIVADWYIHLTRITLRYCLTLLGVHPIVLRDTVRVLKKKYNAPPRGDLLSFIRYIGPVLLNKTN